MWRGFAPLFVLLTLVSWIAPGWGRASGLALKALLIGPTGWGSDTFWTAITFGAVALILFGPKLIYNSVEKTIELLVAIVTIGLIAVVIAIGSAETWKELGNGIVNVGYKDPAMSVKTLFIAFVFAGAGGTANLFYTFYLRDKNIGMGGHLPELQNPLRGRTETVPSTGFIFEETEENRTRFMAWWNYVKKDQLLFCLGIEHSYNSALYFWCTRRIASQGHCAGKRNINLGRGRSSCRSLGRARTHHFLARRRSNAFQHSARSG